MSEIEQDVSLACVEEQLPVRKKKKNKKRNRRWISAIDQVEIGPFLFVPLTCTRDLKEEGYAMEHCVGTYAQECRWGWLRVFSVCDALGGKRLATMSLMMEDDRWNIEQIRGLRNSEVIRQEHTYFDGEQLITELELSDLHYAAMELVEMYRRASEDDPEICE